MKTLDYQFWKDLTTTISHILFSVSILGQHFAGHHLYSKHVVGVVVFFCLSVIFFCLIKMLHSKHYDNETSQVAE